MSALGQSGAKELQYVPRDAAVIAYANVHEVMTSELRQHVRQAVPMPMQENGQRQFQNETGINIETDIDRVVACLEPNGANMSAAGMVLASGRFDEVKIEALMRDRGARVEEYKSKRLIVADHPHGNNDTFAVAFMEPGLMSVGSATLVRRAIEL